jgi:signal transduction histidine kinase
VRLSGYLESRRFRGRDRESAGVARADIHRSLHQLHDADPEEEVAADRNPRRTDSGPGSVLGVVLSPGTDYAPAFDQDDQGLRRVEIDASRARIVAAADEARRRLGRDLHDGAQQSLVLAAISLKRVAKAARGTHLEPLVAEAHSQLQAGMAELRDLAQGLHPTVLTERGLAAALTGLAARAALPVELHVTSERVMPALEAAIYFTVAEALTNVAKHAQATRASVAIHVDGGVLTAEIVDDGIGGAQMAGGSGLQGLVDRLDAVGGTLSVDSPRGAGTRIRARAPLPARGVARRRHRPEQLGLIDKGQ